MRTIYEARSFIKDNKNKHVFVKIMGIRNKNEIVEGTISQCYPNVFILDTDDGVKSFTYTDVLIGNILVKLK